MCDIGAGKGRQQSGVTTNFLKILFFGLADWAVKGTSTCLLFGYHAAAD